MRYLIPIAVCLCVAIGPALAAAEEQTAPADQATVTLPRAEWEAIRARLAAVEQELQDLKARQLPPTPAPPAEVPPPEAPPPAAPSAGKALALPDISLIVQAKGKASTDERDQDRDKVLLTELELGIQGYVYPNVKADAFITMSPSEGASAQVEEAYLSYLGRLRKGLNLYVGQKHVSFGRTNLLHNHSWLYVNPPLVLRNLVAEESLTGQGLDFSYLIPTDSKLFAQLDLGLWAGAEPGEASNPPGIVAGPGANFADKFNTARLWTGYPITENSELELGGSYAGGKAASLDTPTDTITGGRARLTGVDLSYRRYTGANGRLLLRAEGVQRRQSEGAGTAKGYYLFGNCRKTKYASLGLLYSWSEFPQAPNLHESAGSLILTKQFSEQYYLRLQATHGSGPGHASYNELWLQWVWGIGPHTHNLE